MPLCDANEAEHIFAGKFHACPALFCNSNAGNWHGYSGKRECSNFSAYRSRRLVQNTCCRSTISGSLLNGWEWAGRTLEVFLEQDVFTNAKSIVMEPLCRRKPVIVAKMSTVSLRRRIRMWRPMKARRIWMTQLMRMIPKMRKYSLSPWALYGMFRFVSAIT